MHKHRDHKDHCAPDCDDQLPLFARVGRGLRGNTTHVEVVDPDSCTETHIRGWEEDSATGNIISEWISENINGGELYYQYNLRPYTNPRTFTITFVYKRPGRCEWSWTTPAIPYIWSIDPNGKPEEYPDHTVGSGVANVWIKTMHSDEWIEKLTYPEGMTGDDFNAPGPLEPWAASITFGIGGDIEIPDLDDLAKVIGVSPDVIRQWIISRPVQFDNIDAMNVFDYINNCDSRDLDHIHTDLGFCDSDHDQEGAFGGKNTVKEYIDNAVSNAVTNIMQNIADLIHGAEIDEEGNIVIPEGTKIPVGNINLFGNSSHTSYIRTHDDVATNDVRAL